MMVTLPSASTFLTEASAAPGASVDAAVFVAAGVDAA
jgi:hypothetical protein